MARIAEDNDFDHLKKLVDESDDWILELDKADTKVWTRPVVGCSFQMVKIQTVFPDVTSDTLYDVLHDPDYRKIWDSHMLESLEIGLLNVNNDVGYYASELKSLKNFDWKIKFSLPPQCPVHLRSNLGTLCCREAGLTLAQAASKCCLVDRYHTKIFRPKKAT
jgi:START domain